MFLDYNDLGDIMIIGIGTDIIEILRIEKAVASKRFLDRFFTESENEYLKNKNIESYAGYFCAKEAAVKALGTGFTGFKFKDIEVIKLNNVPYIRLHGEAFNIAQNKGIEKIHLSISHCKDYATAVAVAEG